MFDKLFSFGKNRIVRTALALTTIAGLVISQLQPGSIVQAAPILTIESITWDVIGLDSNRPATGPRHFPVGVRVCNEGTIATNDPLTVTFTWTTSNTYISIRPGTTSVLTFPALAAAGDSGDCVDAYFEVEVDGVAAAYRTTRGYTITATDGTESATTPSPRQLYVEYLISQNRNATNMIRYGTDPNNLTDVAAGGSMNLYVGGTYYIQLDAKTATQGYEQLETFITLSNTVFQILSVETTYSANTSPYLTSPHDQLYADACLWENDPNSPNYLACLDSGKKSGGNITVLYEVRIIGGGGTTQTLNSLIYDFSGASYHYNSDYSAGVRFASILTATLDKTFTPRTMSAGDTTTLTFTIDNPSPDPISNVSFTDELLGGLEVADTGIAYTNCGTPTPTSLALGETSLDFANITIAGGATCTVEIIVTASADGTYPNETGNLFIGGDNTGSSGSDTLLVSSQPPAPNSCAPSERVTLATWDFTTSTTATIPPGSNVLFATASATLTGAGSATVTGGYWQLRDSWKDTAGAPAPDAAPYAEFSLDTTNYGGVNIAFNNRLLDNNEWGANNNQIHIYSSADNGTPVLIYNANTTKGNTWQTVPATTAASTGAVTTWFRVSATVANQILGNVQLDNVIITGCPRPEVPTLSKAFSLTSIAVDDISTLTFTFGSPNDSNLADIAFADDLPAGLQVTTPNGLTGITCSAGSVVLAPTITATAGTSTISMAGLTLAGNSVCSFSVDVTGTASGQYTNITSAISAPTSGANTGADGFGEADLEVIAPPTINKVFGSTFLLTGETTSLAFSISNPNNFTSLTGIAFTDILPAGVTVADGGAVVCGGTLTTTNPSTIALSGGTLAAGETCTFSVTVTGASPNDAVNTVTVSSTEGGTGNTSTAEMQVRTPVASMNFQKQIGLSDNPDAAWFSYLVVEEETPVYYKFTIENTGDVELTNLSVVDAALTALGVDLSACQIASLPVADDGDNQIFTC
ncbi:MAG: hypothetical protein R6W69_07395, partial [Anaerolineales bacterium]